MRFTITEKFVVKKILLGGAGVLDRDDNAFLFLAGCVSVDCLLGWEQVVADMQKAVMWLREGEV